MDLLAGDGIILRNYYTQPLCSPTRGAFMTGRYPVRLGLQQSRMYKLAVTLPAAPSPELKAEAEALVQSYQAFPLNIGCLRESNAGTLLPGVCY